MSYFFHPEAKKELLEAIKYYNECGSGLGYIFMEVRHDGPPSPGDYENFATKTPSRQEFFYNKPLGVPLCLCAFVAIFMVDGRGLSRNLADK